MIGTLQQKPPITPPMVICSVLAPPKPIPNSGISSVKYAMGITIQKRILRAFYIATATIPGTAREGISSVPLNNLSMEKRLTTSDQKTPVPSTVKLPPIAMWRSAAKL